MRVMDSVSSSRDRDVRRFAASERRVARQSSSSNVGSNFLSKISLALANVDRYTNDYITKKDDDNHAISDSNGNGRHDSETITFYSSGNNNGSSSNSNCGVHNNSPYHLNKKSTTPSHFSSYLKFNRLSLKFILGFAVCYIIILICFYPMVYYSDVDVLQTDGDYTKGTKHLIQRGAFQHVRGRKQFIKAISNLRNVEKKMINSTLSWTMGPRDGDDVMKASLLLEQAVHDFEGNETDLIKNSMEKGLPGHDHWKEALESWDKELVAAVVAPPVEDANDAIATANQQGVVSHDEAKDVKYTKTPGFIVLGMHRSGTSMLSGLLVKGFGYEPGGPLIGASFDNEKGFYERIDVVVQNDEFMEAQRTGWSWNVLNYDPQMALEHKAQGVITFNDGKKALAFLNNPHRALPYLQKDPRMCITLPTWLQLLDHKPAIVFTYRHPLEVALSLKHREKDWTLEHGLRLWLSYNMRAVQYSADLCRVLSTNEAIFNSPAKEVQRIKDELTDKCNVKLAPKASIPIDVVNKFVDPKLQHNKKEREADKDKHKILNDFGNDCVARDFASDYEENTANRRAEVELYLMAMQVFCDLENGKAYSKEYKWPDLLHWQRPQKLIEDSFGKKAFLI